MAKEAPPQVEPYACGFFCHACLEDKPSAEVSSDPRYCQGCYDFLIEEAELLDDRKLPWVPKDSQAITRTPLEPFKSLYNQRLGWDIII